MKVLVTGGSGFLGSHVAEQLVLAGHDVRALVRKTSNTKFLKSLSRVELAEGAVEDADAVSAAVDGVDAIVHSAALVKARNDGEFQSTNVQGTKNLVAAVRKRAPRLLRFVHVSSLEAAGPAEGGLPVLASQERPITRYGRSKLESEKVVLGAKDDFPVTILRPGGIYGPRDVEIFEVFKSVKRGVLPIVGTGLAKSTLVYGPDCAKACVRALFADVPSGSIYFVTDGATYDQRLIAAAVEKAWGTRARIRFALPMGLVRGVAYAVEGYGRFRDKAVMLTREKAAMLNHDWLCESESTMTALDWKPEFLFDEGAKVTAKWYADNGWV